MLNCALPVFLLMLGAASLAGLLSWLLANRELRHNTEEVPQLKNKLAQVKEEVDRLLEYTNSFHMEKRVLTEENESLTEQLSNLQVTLNQLSKDKGFLLAEFNRLNAQIEEEKSEEFFFDEGMEVAVAEPATDDAHLNQIVLEKQLQDIHDELTEWKTKYEAIKDSLSKKERKIVELDDLSLKDQAKAKTKKWESKYKKLKLKLVAVTKERDASLSQLETLKMANDQLLTELLSVKNLRINQPEGKKREKEEVFVRIKKRKDLLDFQRIGKYTSKQKDDLKKISGVGPFIEKKLNALGIYKFEQLAKLNDTDIQEIIKIIEVPSGIIKGADWIEQAKNMK